MMNYDCKMLYSTDPSPSKFNVQNEDVLTSGKIFSLMHQRFIADTSYKTFLAVKLVRLSLTDTYSLVKKNF